MDLGEKKETFQKSQKNVGKIKKFFKIISARMVASKGFLELTPLHTDTLWR